MKTPFFFLASLQVITAIINEKLCNHQAEEIASQDCQEQCYVTPPGEDCAKCIMQHKDHYVDCRGTTYLLQCMKTEEKIAKEDCKEKCIATAPLYDFEACETCIRNHQDYDTDCKGSRDMLCMKTFVEILEDECKEECPIQHPGGKDFEFNRCKTCFMSHQDFSLACLIHTVEFFRPPSEWP